jgi:hypothetical protein
VGGHLGLDLDGGEGLAVLRNVSRCSKTGGITHVDTDDGTDHLGDDDHVTEVGLDHGGLLVGGSVLLGLTELLDETHGLALESALEPPAGTSVHKLMVSMNIPTGER